MKMDTSTPVRNFKSTCCGSVLKPTVEDDTELSIKCSGNSSIVQNRETGPSSTSNLSKSVELFPFSPIAHPENVPHILLPLLDTPNLKWSNSLLTPYGLYQQNETPSQIIEQRIISNDKSFQHESAVYSPIQTFNDIKPVDESPLMKYSNSVKRILNNLVSPVIKTSPASKSKKLSNRKCVNKKLFPVSEETAPNNDTLYQCMSDTTLDAIEQICQVSETLYSNSPTVASKLATDDSNTNSSLKTEKSCLIGVSSSCSQTNNGNLNFNFDSSFDFEDSTNNCSQSYKYKNRFVYPYNAIQKPAGTLLMDEVMESVLSLEQCDRVCVTKSKLIPRAMVSFNELNSCENNECISFPTYDPRPVAATVSYKNTKPRFRALATVMRRHEDVYHSVKSFFVICRVDFAEVREVITNRQSVESQLPIFCKKENLISRLNKELLKLEEDIRIRLLDEFFEFFRCHFYLIYNFRLNRCVHDDTFYRQIRERHVKKSLVQTKRKMVPIHHSKSEYGESGGLNKSKVNNSVVSEESLVVAERLLADVNDFDFELDTDFYQAIERNESVKSSTSMLCDQISNKVISSEREPSPKFVSSSPAQCRSKLRNLWSRTDFSQLIDFKSKEKEFHICDDTFAAEKVFHQSHICGREKLEIHSEQFNGFSTASGSKIKISKESISRVKKLFDNIADDPLDVNFSCVSTAKDKISVPDEEQACDREMLKNISNKISLERTGCENKTESNFPGSEEKLFSKDAFMANGVFKTAGGTRIKIKEQFIARGKEMLRNVSDQILSTYSLGEDISVFNVLSKKRPLVTPLQEISTGFSTADGKRVKVNDNLIAPDKQLVESISEGLNSPKSSSLRPFTNGFSTASGKNIKVNKDSLIRATNILEHILENSDVLDERKFETKQFHDLKKPSEFPQHQNVNDYPGDLSDSVIDEFFNEYPPQKTSRTLSPEIGSSRCRTAAKRRKVLENTTAPKISFSFNTAAGKKLHVPEEALKKAEQMFEDIDDAKEFRPTLPEMSLSSSTISRQHKELEFLPVDNHKLIMVPEISGFNTAAAKKLHVPKEALKRAEKLFQDVNNDLDKGSDAVLTEISFQPSAVTRQQVKMPEIALEDNNELPSISRSSVGFNTSGFDIASRKKLQVQHQSIDDEFKSDSPKIDLNSCTSFSRQPKNNKAQTVAGVTVGFNTASGKKLNVPEATLKRAKKLLEGVDDDLTKLFKCTSPEPIPNINIIYKEPKLVPKIDNESVLAATLSVGFNTAAGKKLHVPEAALKRAENLFQNIDDDLLTNCKPVSPEIGLNSSTISQKRHVKFKSPIKDDGSTLQSFEMLKNTVHLNSAAEKKVRVSEDILKRAEMLFRKLHEEDSVNSILSDPNGLDIPVKGKFVVNESADVSKSSFGFNTASGKILKVPKSALNKAKKVFQGINDNLCKEDAENVETDFCELGNAFKETKQNLDVLLNDFSDGPTIATDGAKKYPTVALSSNIVSISDEFLKTRQSNLESSENEHDFEALPRRNPESMPSEKLIELESERKLEVSKGNSDLNLLSDSRSKPVTEKTSRMSQEISESISAFERDQTSSTRTKITPPGRSRPTSPVFETRKGAQQKRSLKRRSQTFAVNLNVTPLEVTYNRKDNDSTLSSKTSPEDILKKIKDNFSQRSNKRKEAASSTLCPTPKRLRESVLLNTVTIVEQQKYVESKPKEDCKPKIGSYLLKQQNEKRISLRQAVNNLRPSRYNVQKLVQLGVRPEVIAVDVDNAGQFVFLLNVARRPIECGDECTIIPNENNEVRFEDLTRGFLASPGVDPKLISEAWIRNHFRWIVWKLASFEKSYPNLFARKQLTLDNVLRQLKYRYDREIDRCERSALKRILECDDTPSRSMVLCVAAVKPVLGALNEFELELTDGWYSVLSQSDIEMYKLIAKKRIVVGCKLIIMNAEFIGLNEGCDPLEVPSSVRMKISTNSTRLVRWDTRLGFYSSASTPLICNLKAILPNGGIMYPVLAVIARIYPLMYMEKGVEGNSELYNEKMEFKKVAHYESERQACLEQLASVITREIEQENCIGDSDEYIEDGTSAEIVALQNSRYMNQERLQHLIRERIESRLPEKFRNKRKVLCLLKIRIVNNDFDGNSPCSAIITIWNPSEDITSILKEGKLYKFHNLNANDIRNQELRLSSCRMTKYELQSLVPKSNFHQRRYIAISDLKSDFVSTFNELDTVGVVINGEDDHRQDAHGQQTAYLADIRQNIIAVKFRSSLADYGFEETLKRKSFVAAINLQWKGGLLYWKIPIAIVTDCTNFTQKSKYQHLQSRLNEFETYFRIECLDSFVEQCEKKLKSFAESSCPVATSTPIKNIISKNTIANYSNVSERSDSSINVSGNCDRSIKSKDIQSRIDRLQRYGEPPPLSPINIANVRPKRARLSIRTCSFRSHDSKS